MLYLSPTSNEPCTAAQYIAEIVTRREADKKKIVLQNKWWNYDPWRKKYAQNVIAANSLLKLYDAVAIIRALGRKECQWQWSLRVKILHDYFREEQTKLETEKKAIVESKPIEVQSTEIKVQPTFGRESKLNKLRD